MSSNRWLIAGGLLLALVIGGSIAVGTTRRGETEFPPDSPEATVQRYVRAIEAEDAAAIRDTLSPSTQERCQIAEIRNGLRYPDERDLRVTLRDTSTNGNSAEVKVRVTESTGSGPFDSGSYDHDQTFDLVRVNNTWLIEQPTWPFFCPPKPIPPAGVAPATPAPTVVVTPRATSTPAAAPNATPASGN